MYSARKKDVISKDLAFSWIDKLRDGRAQGYGSNVLIGAQQPPCNLSIVGVCGPYVSHIFLFPFRPLHIRIEKSQNDKTLHRTLIFLPPSFYPSTILY